MPLVDVDYEMAEDFAGEETAAPSPEPVAFAQPEQSTETTQSTERTDGEEPPMSAKPPVPQTPTPFQTTAPEISRDQSSFAVKAREFQSRISSAQNRAAPQPAGEEENFETLLDQAVTLLESVAAHPALADYSALKQRLDNVEQLLNTSANVR